MQAHSRILIGAQSFGYGPSAKMAVLGRELGDRGARVTPWVQGVAAEYAARNGLEDKELDGNLPLEDVAAAHFDAVVTVMDPRLAAWGYTHDLPVYVIDSLYWFWHWPEPAEARRIAEELRPMRGHARLPELLAAIERLPPHTQQFAAHALATHSLVQHYPGARSRPHLDQILRPTIIAPLIDRAWRTDTTGDAILVSLAGMVNPLVTPAEMRLYLHLVDALVNLVLGEERARREIIVAVNPTLLVEARRVFGSRARALDHAAFLTTLDRSALILAPPGLTTLYESLAYGTPIFFLPEQHDGHFKNYERLALAARGGEAAFRAAFPESLAAYRFPIPRDGDPVRMVRALYTLYQHLLSHHDPVDWGTLGASLQRAGTCALSDEGAAHYRRAQGTLGARLDAGYPGADDLIAVALSPRSSATIGNRTVNSKVP